MLRGTQEFSVMEEFYEEHPSAHRTWWHRKQLWHIYGLWADWTALGTVLPGKGDAVMEEWAVQGRVSSSRWTKHRGEVVEEGGVARYDRGTKTAPKGGSGATCRQTGENGRERARSERRQKP